MNNSDIKIIAEAAFNHAAKKLELKEKSQQQLYVAHNGGMFKATPELMTFLTIDWNNPHTDMVIEDSYGNPISIEREQLLVELKQCYQTVMNDWEIEYQKLLRIRNGKQV
jgi:hypothetical protein